MGPTPYAETRIVEVNVGTAAPPALSEAEGSSQAERGASATQLTQQLTASSLHCRRTVSSSLVQDLYHSLSKTKLRLSQVSQSLQSEGPHNGAAVFQITLQQRHRALSFL